MSTPGPVPALEPARGLVAQALEALEQVADRPVAEHVAVLDGVHRCLQDALAALHEV